MMTGKIKEVCKFEFCPNKQQSRGNRGGVPYYRAYCRKHYKEICKKVDKLT